MALCASHFTRKEIKQGWRLGCQCKVKGDLKIHVDESILGVKEYECTVISNKNVATFIKEFKVQLPAGAHMDFLPGSYAQIKIPAFDCIDYNSYDRDLITPEYVPSWEKFKMFDLKCKNPEPTIRAYSMANYPAEGDVFMLTVRIATPPFKPKPDSLLLCCPPMNLNDSLFIFRPDCSMKVSRLTLTFSESSVNAFSMTWALMSDTFKWLWFSVPMVCGRSWRSNETLV